MPDNRTYRPSVKHCAMIAGLMAIPEALRADDARPGWFGYAATDDVDADAARVKEAGGTIKRASEDFRMSAASPSLPFTAGCSYSSSPEGPKPVAPMTSARALRRNDRS